MEGKYCKLRIKSILRSYPTIILITLVTIAAVICACLLLMPKGEDEGVSKILVGVVGDLKDTYFDIGIQAFAGTENEDNPGFYLELVNMESEEQAQKALKKREIGGYLLVPDNYVKDIYRGKNNPAKYVVLNEPTGFGSIISDEVVHIVSDVVIESQNGMYSMQLVAKDQKAKEINKKVSDLMLIYVDNILNRKDLYKDTYLGISDGLTYGGYYVCGLFILLMLLWGIACSKVFSGDDEYFRMLKVAGLKPEKQVLSEYRAYFAVTVLTFLAFALIAGAALSFVNTGIRELEGKGVFSAVLFLILITPAIATVTMMQTAVYELIRSKIGALLCQFMITVVLGYISGCFYPIGFFPEVLQKIAYVLPVGASFAYVRKVMTGEFPIVEILMLCAYFALFLSITVKMRKNKVTGDMK